jgi:hypothetical protein
MLVMLNFAVWNEAREALQEAATGKENTTT